MRSLTYRSAILVLGLGCHPQEQNSTSGPSSTSSTSGTSTSSSGSSTTAGTPACGDGLVPDESACFTHHELDGVENVVAAVADDFDQNGTPEIAFICQATDHALCHVTIAAGVWTLESVTPLPWIVGSPTVHSANFDEDPGPELVVSMPNRFTIYKFQGGTWAELTTVTDGLDDFGDVTRAWPVQPIDVDDDGVSELLVDYLWSGVRTWHWDGALWTQSETVHALPACGSLGSAAVADLNDDGVDDLAALGHRGGCDGSPTQPSSSWDRVAVFTGDPVAHDLAPWLDFPANIAATQIVHGHFNADSVLDLAITDDTNIFVFPAQDGSFWSQGPIMPNVLELGAGKLIAAELDATPGTELVGRGPEGTYPIFLAPPDVQQTWEVTDPKVRALLTHSDFNGDGLADLVFRDGESSPHPVIWLSNP